MVHIEITNIKSTLYDKELEKLETFKKKNPNKQVKVYYTTLNGGIGFRYVATTEYPKVKYNGEVTFTNYEDITDYDLRTEEF